MSRYFVQKVYGKRFSGVNPSALAQRMVWVNHLLDDSYSSLWKTIEVAALVDFHCDVNILWKSYAPESLLTKLKNNQLADSIRTWYIFRAKAVKDLLDFDTEDFSSQEYLWFNRRVRSNSKQLFDDQDWYDVGGARSEVAHAEFWAWQMSIKYLICIIFAKICPEHFSGTVCPTWMIFGMWVAGADPGYVKRGGPRSKRGARWLI